jgi:hypothetical protein
LATRPEGRFRDVGAQRENSHCCRSRRAKG